MLETTISLLKFFKSDNTSLYPLMRCYLLKKARGHELANKKFLSV